MSPVLPEVGRTCSRLGRVVNIAPQKGPSRKNRPDWRSSLTKGLRDSPLKICAPTKILAGDNLSRRHPEARKCNFQPISSELGRVCAQFAWPNEPGIGKMCPPPGAILDKRGQCSSKLLGRPVGIDRKLRWGAMFEKLRSDGAANRRAQLREHLPAIFLRDTRRAPLDHRSYVHFETGGVCSGPSGGTALETTRI